MIFGINKELKSGEKVDLTFLFNDNKGKDITKVFKFTIK